MKIRVEKGISRDVLQQSQLLRVQGSSGSPRQLCRGDKTCSSSQVTCPRSLANLSPPLLKLTRGCDAFRGHNGHVAVPSLPAGHHVLPWSGNGATPSSFSRQSSEKPSGCLTRRLRGRCRSATDNVGTSFGHSATTPPTLRSSRCWASPNQKVTASWGQGGTSNSRAPRQQAEGYVPCRKNPARFPEGNYADRLHSWVIPSLPFPIPWMMTYGIGSPHTGMVASDA